MAGQGDPIAQYNLAVMDMNMQGPLASTDPIGMWLERFCDQNIAVLFLFYWPLCIPNRAYTAPDGESSIPAPTNYYITAINGVRMVVLLILTN
jgi:hypothetical protein